jgi:hypothetical protein
MMKQKQIELDVNFIGGHGSLTKEEEIAISEYLKAKKMLRTKKSVSKLSIYSRKKVKA